MCDALLRLEKPPKTLPLHLGHRHLRRPGRRDARREKRTGSDFLAEVCKEWEAATEPVRPLGIRVVNLRFGIILSPAGGALAKTLVPFKLGLGGVIGSGKQYWSWIEIDDVISTNPACPGLGSLAGPVNVVAPTRRQTASSPKPSGHVLKRPTVLPLPAFAARLALGEMADGLLLASARVMPRTTGRDGLHFSLSRPRAGSAARAGHVVILGELDAWPTSAKSEARMTKEARSTNA